MKQEEQCSRKKRKQFFILCCIIFTLIICAIIAVITALKHQIDSESLSNNPINAICELTRYHSHCIESLSSSSLLHNTTSSHQTQAYISDVFRLSIDAALQEFLIVSQLPRDLASKAKNRSFRTVLNECQNLFNHSLSQLNASMIMITRGYDEGMMMKDLRVLMEHAKNNVDVCVDGLLDVEGRSTEKEIVEIEYAKTMIEEGLIGMLNSLDILMNEDSIREVFNPSFSSVFASLVFRENYVVIAVFCSQYVFLVVLVAFLLKIFT